MERSVGTVLNTCDKSGKEVFVYLWCPMATLEMSVFADALKCFPPSIHCLALCEVKEQILGKSSSGLSLPVVRV